MSTVASREHHPDPEVQSLLDLCYNLGQEHGVRARLQQRGMFTAYWTPALGSRGIYIHRDDIHKMPS